MKRSQRILGLILIAASSLLLSSSALAQDEPVLELTTEHLPPPDVSADGRKPGWDYRINLGSTLNVSDNRSVIGQPDGSTMSFGFKYDTLLNYNHEASEWRNTLGIQEAISRTPIVDEFVKSVDTVDFETIYLYHIEEWWGPYARFALGTQAFRGHDVRPAVTNYSIARVDGTVDTVAAQRLTLTDPFLPMRLKQSIGPFLRPLSREEINVEMRVGLGAREIFADQQLAVTDDEATEDVVEVTELTDSQQVGVEAALELWGDLYRKTVAYRAGAEVLIPFATSEVPAGQDSGAIDLMSVELGAALSFKLVEWASLDYEIKALREPLLLDEFQVQNNLLLTFGISYGSSDDAPPCECE